MALETRFTEGEAVEGPEAYGATIYTLVIDGEGAGGQPDTFAWGDGKTFDTPHRQIPITGDWQSLSHGVEIRFAHRNGHSLRSLWFVSYDGPEAYGIRIGHGRQADPIENVRITGRGTLDLNSANNAQPSGLVADNLRIQDNTDQPVVIVNSPRGWQPPEPPELRNNHNQLSERAPVEAN